MPSKVRGSRKAVVFTAHYLYGIFVLKLAWYENKGMESHFFDNFGPINELS